MAYISDVTINGSNSPISASLRGNCSTASATAAKAVNCSVFDTLKEGVSIFVTFTNDNTASNPTLNVNSTGAKAIKNGSSTDIKWNAGVTVQFMYDGTNWQQVSSAGNYAPIESPTFTGTPKAPTPATSDNSTNIATTAFVKTEIMNAITNAIGGEY